MRLPALLSLVARPTARLIPSQHKLTVAVGSIEHQIGSDDLRVLAVIPFAPEYRAKPWPAETAGCPVLLI